MISTQTPSLPARRSPWRASLIDHLALIFVLAGLVAYFSFTASNFFSRSEFATIANQIPSTVIVAVGMTYVLIIGGIDLSVGSVLGLSAAVTGALMTMNHPMPFALAALVGLLAGLLCGAINGLVTVTWPVPSFVVTLGMLEIARGATYLLTQSRSHYIGERVEGLASSSILGLSLPFWIAIAIVALGQIVLTRTVFGRYMIAVGTNEEAVRLSGISTGPVKLAVFMIAGLLSAVGAIIEISRAGSSIPNAGTGLELNVIAAVVVGGTSLLGGRGSVIKSLLGVVIIAVLGAGLAARGSQDETKRLITGCVIVLASILDYYRHRFTAAR